MKTESLAFNALDTRNVWKAPFLFLFLKPSENKGYINPNTHSWEGED